MELLKRILASTKTTIVLSILFVIFFAIDFEIIASYLYGNDNPSNKGQLFGTTLTAIGGICVIWGLYLNNKKVNQQIRQVNEQVRQNDIAIQNSNDKRFGEAIGYLNDDNEGIAIGGIYALYQLAKEDERYAPIITNIFYNYVNDNTDKQDKKSYQTILSLLFSKDNPFVFGKQYQFKNINFRYTTLFCCIDDMKFYKCRFEEVNLIGKKGVMTSDCDMKGTVFIDFSAVRIYAGNFKRSAIISNKLMNINLEAAELSDFEIIVNGSLPTLIIDSDMIDDVRVYANSIYWLSVYHFLSDSPYSKLSIHYVSKISEKRIDSKISESNAIEFIQDDEVKSDKFYRRRAGLEDIN